jgi:hypothetical protein
MTLDCVELAIIQKKIEEFWRKPNLVDIDLIPIDGVAKAILDNQDVILGELASKQKARTIQVIWPTKCEVETRPCGDICDIDGEDVTPECDEYQIECLRETSFKMQKRAYRERFDEFADNFAYNVVRHKKGMIDWLNQGLATWLIGNAGVNQFVGGIGNVAGGVTTIPASHWDENFWVYLMQVKEMNRFNSPYFITGTNAYAQIVKAKMAGESERMWNAFRPMVDPFSMAQIGAQNSSLLVNKNSAAFLNKAWNPLGMNNAIPQEGGKYLEWSDSLGLNIASPVGDSVAHQSTVGLPSIFVDILLKEWCEGKDFYVGVTMTLWGAAALNPTPCNKDVTGILYLECA